MSEPILGKSAKLFRNVGSSAPGQEVWQEIHLGNPAISSDEAGLLAAIRATPADDVARLVYADWLDENGQHARAEFIRVQMELAALPPAPVVVRPVQIDIEPGEEELVEEEQRQYPARRVPNWRVFLQSQRLARLLVPIGPEIRHGDVIDVALEAGRVHLVGALVKDVCLPRPDSDFLEVVVAGPMDHYRHRAKRNELTARSQELLAGPRPDIYEHETIWFNSGNGTDTWRILFRPKWRRGFVESVTCAAARWIAEGDAIRRSHPVTRIVVSDIPFLTSDATGCSLLGDPLRRSFTDQEITAEQARETGAPDNGKWLRALLRLRWPGAAFEVRGGRGISLSAEQIFNDVTGGFPYSSAIIAAADFRPIIDPRSSIRLTDGTE